MTISINDTTNLIPESRFSINLLWEGVPWSDLGEVLEVSYHRYCRNVLKSCHGTVTGESAKRF